MRQAERTANAPAETDGELHLSPAQQQDFEAVATLFEALHRYNASLNEQFALAPQWHQILYKHFEQTSASEEALWLLAWIGSKPIGLLILEQHLDSPLFFASSAYRTGCTLCGPGSAWSWRGEAFDARSDLLDSTTRSVQDATLCDGTQRAGPHLLSEFGVVPSTGDLASERDAISISSSSADRSIL